MNYQLPVIVLLYFMALTSASAQEKILDKNLDLRMEEVTVKQVLDAIEEQTGYEFSYSPDMIDLEKRVTVSYQGVRLQQVLRDILGTQAGGIRVDGRQIRLQPRGGFGTIRGVVRGDDGLPVPYAFVSISNTNSAHTDEEGVYVMHDVEAGNRKVNISAVGFNKASAQVDVFSGQTVTLDVMLTQNNHLSEVVVTAGRVKESIDEVPSSVTILGAGDIEDQMNINTSISDILSFTIPGLGPTSNKATNSGQTLRGRSVLVLIDGIPQSTPLLNGNRDIRSLDPMVIRRVEVIKGATSIYGNGSGGGIINYITKNPESDKKISGQTLVGASGHVFHPSNSLGYRVSQLFNGKLDKFSYVVSGTYNSVGIFRDGDGNVLAYDDGLSESYSANVYAKAAYDFTPSAKLTVAYNYFRSMQDTDYINQPGTYPERPAYGVKGENPGAPSGTPQNHNVYLSYRHDDLFGDTSMEFSAYYNRFLSTNRYIESASGWYGPGQSQISSIKKGLRLNLHTPWQFGQKVTGNVVYGADILGDVTSQPLLDGRVYVPDMDMTNVAPYLQVKATLWDDFVFKGGLRYENASVKVKDFQTLPKGPDGEGSIGVTGGTINYKATMFNAGLRYTRFDYFNPFVSFSQAFGLNELGRVVRAAEESTLSDLKTDAIITNNYEVGADSRFSVFHLTGAFYVSTSKLGANLVANEYGTLIPKRAPERIHGFEFTADAHINPQWSLGATYAYVEGKAEQEDGSRVFLGYSRIAPPKATANVQYKPSDRFKIQLFWVYTGHRDRFAPQENGMYRTGEGPVHSVNLFNLNSTFKITEAFKCSLGVENLFNNSYYPFYSQYSAHNDRYYMGYGTRASLNFTYSF